jgi:hypothetical protein
MPSPIFSASTFPPHNRNDETFKIRYEKILSVSREKYCKPKVIVEEKINKTIEEINQQEQIWESRKAKNKK